MGGRQGFLIFLHCSREIFERQYSCRREEKERCAGRFFPEAAVFRTTSSTAPGQAALPRFLIAIVPISRISRAWERRGFSSGTEANTDGSLPPFPALFTPTPFSSGKLEAGGKVLLGVWRMTSSATTYRLRFLING